MKDGDQFWIPPHPQPAADRAAHDLAEARLARVRETRLRLVEVVAPEFVGCTIEKGIAAAKEEFREIVDALERFIEPTDDCGGNA